MNRKTWKDFEEIQPYISQLLQRSMRKNRISHAYLFSGDRGTGKKDMTLHLAKSLFCKHMREDENPCNECIDCKRIAQVQHPNVYYVEPDGLSIKKHQMEALQKEFYKTGVESNQKLYIISEIDKMTDSAANSLLKFMEEPHQETYAILLTTSPNKVLPTIKSRCQMLTFIPLAQKIVQDQLIKKEFNPSIAVLASYVSNNIEEAISLCESDWFAQARRLVIKLYETIHFEFSSFFIYLQKEFLPHFEDREQIQLALKMLFYVYKEGIQFANGSLKVGSFYDEMGLRGQSNHKPISIKKIIRSMNYITEASNKIQSHVSPQVALEELAIKLQEV